MMRALYTAASGMKAGQTNVDTIAHNLSNVNTNGYKAARAEFKTLLYQTIQASTTSANGEDKPVGAQVGLGTRVANISSVYTQGILAGTESATDFAVEGDGFFAVRGVDGETYYTRNGSFTWSVDAAGNTFLADVEGCPVLDREGNAIYVPEGISAESMIFSNTGEISYRLQDGTAVELNQAFALYQFNNPAGLEKLSNSRLQQTEASGQPMLEGTMGTISSKVNQYYLEGSNVQVADEMVNLIIAQRAYEMNSKAIQTADSMLQTANELKR